MPDYSGSFQYVDERRASLTQGPCRLSFDADTCVVTPASGQPLAFDFGDVEGATAGEWELELTLYTGATVQLRKFGAAFGRMSQELMTAWRDRTVRCLMLEDLEEVARFHGTAATGTTAAKPAEVRIYKSNIAILPAAGFPVQRRLAELDSATFDEASYAVTIRSGGDRLVVSRLGKETDEFVGTLNQTLDALRAHSAGAMRDLFPFLDPDQLQRLLIAIPEGRSVRLAALTAIHPKLPEALVARAVDARLKPYFDALRGRGVADSIMAGYKFIQKEEEETEDSGTASAEPPDDAGGEDEAAQPVFFWFFIPLAQAPGSGRFANVVAWEASTGSGRATYFFRLVPPAEADSLGDPAQAVALVESAVARLTRGLALVNFRREPIYLPDESLEQPRFHRYAIGCRKLPDLRGLRESFLGRAIHTSLETWSAAFPSL